MNLEVDGDSVFFSIYLFLIFIHFIFFRYYYFGEYFIHANIQVPSFINPYLRFAIIYFDTFIAFSKRASNKLSYILKFFAFKILPSLNERRLFSHF